MSERLDALARSIWRVIEIHLDPSAVSLAFDEHDWHSLLIESEREEYRALVRSIPERCCVESGCPHGFVVGGSDKPGPYVGTSLTRIVELEDELATTRATADKLDVSRLFAAIHAASIGCGQTYVCFCRSKAENIAKEYAVTVSVPFIERRIGPVDRRTGPGHDLHNLHERRSFHRRAGDYSRRVLGV